MLEKLEKLKVDPFYKNYFKKLKADDWDYMNKFIDELDELNYEQKVLAVYRSAMRENKPKNWTAIEELLSIAIK